jgi:hypothetical protein
MPTEDEWVKAAYFNGTSLQTYATTDNSIPTAGIDTNYNSSLSHPWDVGSGTEELNGTFDMMGNAYEWIESLMDRGDYLSPVRGVRGGSYGSTQLTLEVSYRDYAGFQNYEGPYYGFRVASVATPNNPPVADAGDDQAIYVCIDGIAEVTLDGSDSSDIDYNELTYYWSWMIDDEIYDANGVAPIIELPVGKYIIQLIVNDGIEDSEPNEVVVTMIDSIELLDILADYIIDLGLHSRIESSLLAKIDTAIDKLEDDNDKNDKAAISSLRAFINAVKAQSGKKILQEDAGYLIETAQQAIDVSSCE